ncbi:chondroitin polymerizing factor [Oratosquilla oratoria]|uniref:chondroitin polymerizing factor n=1 Tax=Oratosquilla oratoria TaxID=337810 RepID=UPI003F75CB1D
MALVKPLIYYKQSSSVIIGLCIGIALSLIRTPFDGEDCLDGTAGWDFYSSEQLSKLRDLRSNDPGSEDDYEPRLIQNDDIGQFKQEGAKLVRPRYYSTELGMKEKLFVAVISTKEDLRTFGIAINKTLNHYVDKAIFFADGIGSQKPGLSIPIVGFKDSKPLLLIFRILSYISENYLNDYDYFFLVTSRTYTHGQKLRHLVERISVSEDVHMGTRLDGPDSSYCSLDEGILLSHSMLQHISTNLQWCTQNAFSSSHDYNLGRCIMHSHMNSCKSRLQGQHYYSYHLRKGVEVNSHLDVVGSSLIVREAVTVSNVPEANDMYRLHLYYLQQDLKKANASLEAARQEIAQSQKSWVTDKDNEAWPLGSAQPHKPHTRFDIVRWDTFNQTHIFLPNDFTNAKPLMGADLKDIMSVVNASASYLQTISGGFLQFHSLQYGHRKFDPTRGVDYVLSLFFRDNVSGQLVSKKMEASRPLTQPELIPMPYVTESNRIILVLPIHSSEINKAMEYIERYEEECLEGEGHTTLLLVLHQKPVGLSKTDTKDIYKALKNRAQESVQKLKDVDSKVSWVIIKTSKDQISDFALVDLVVKKFPIDTLVYMTSLTAHVTNDFLNRVRMNTILGWQIFSAIPFTLYDPDIVEDQIVYEKMDVNRNTGHLDRYNFDHICFYVGDYLSVRRSLQETIPLFRSDKDLKRDHPEDYEFGLYGMFVQVSDLHVLRAVEPALKLSYAAVECSGLESNERLQDFCVRRQEESLGLRPQLSKLILDYEEQVGHKLS